MRYRGCKYGLNREVLPGKLRYLKKGTSGGKFTVPTISGLLQNDMLGPLCYSILPRLLDKSLATAGAGIAKTVTQSQYKQIKGVQQIDNWLSN